MSTAVETKAPEKTGRLNSLTGLRAIAALVVFLAHMGIHDSTFLGRIFSGIADQGAIGVTFFFALSGFVLTWSSRSSDTKRAFWRRRFARIYPAYFVALLVGVAVTLVRGTALDVGPFVASATLIQSWVPDADYFFSLNGVSWTLSCEAFFYLCFPFIIPMMLRLSKERRRALQAAAFSCMVATVIVGEVIGGSLGSWFILHFPVTRSMEFILGCTVAIDVIRGQFVRLPVVSASLIALAAYLSSGVFNTAFSTTVIPIIPFVLLLGACADRDSAGGQTMFSGKTLVWLGQISYCFYLVHQMVIRVIRGAVGQVFDVPWNSNYVTITSGLIALPCSIVAAWALYELVERPLEKRIRNRSGSASEATSSQIDLTVALVNPLESHSRVP